MNDNEPGSAVEGLKARLDAEQMDFDRAAKCGCSICRCWLIARDAIALAEQQEARAERYGGLLREAGWLLENIPDETSSDTAENVAWTARLNAFLKQEAAP